MTINYKTFKFWSVIAIIIFLSLIAIAVSSRPQKKSSTTTATRSLQIPDLQKLLNIISLPKNDPNVKRITTTNKDYSMETSVSGNIDKPVSFNIKGGQIDFTSLPNQNLGNLNNSTVSSKDGKTIYNNIYNGISLIYTPSANGILEEYEVRTKRTIQYLAQKIDLTNLTFKKQGDGSIIFTNTKGEFAFAIPKPVMYEEFNIKNRNYGLHYEIFNYKGNTYLVKVIDSDGQKWLSDSNYPVMIDATILLTLFSYHSYPTVNNNWQIGIETVGSGDLQITPTGGTTLSLSSDPSKDLDSINITCNGKEVTYQTSGSGIIIPNFSCDKDIIVATNVNTPQKQNGLNFAYSGFITTVSSIVATGKPIIISSSLNPPVVKVGDTITVKVEVADDTGVNKVTADMGGIDTINLSLVSGNDKDGVWQGNWQVHNTKTLPYQVLITASNATESTISSIGFFDPYTCLGGGDHAGAAWDPATDCPSGFAGNHTNIGTLSVGAGETATVKVFDQVSNYGIATVSASTVTIASTGKITADSAGWAGGAVGVNGSGPGGGTGSGGGGGYGGSGGNTVGGGTYGSLTIPGDLGSGGSGGTGAGGAGGGSIRIATTGTLTINGTISANGGTGVGSCHSIGGGGSGGSIYLTANTLAGNGTVSSKGGDGWTGGCDYYGSGGGGRITMYFTSSNTYSGTISVDPGTVMSAVYSGSAGTAFIENSNTNDLTIPTNNSIWKESDMTSWSFGNLSINGNVTFQATNATLLTISSSGTTTIGSNVTITVGGSNTTNSNGVGVYFNLTGSVTVPSTSAITARGYAGGGASGSGPGGGTGAGGGGGYGGAGGGAGGGGTYGSSNSPSDLGSGGSAGSGAGGAGGGAIKITATGTLTVSGTLSANGASGVAFCHTTGGGGSGGSIYLLVPILAGSGTISANGGDGGSGACDLYGNGGGGRIAVSYTVANSWAGNSLTPAGATAAGTNGIGGANGTVYTSPIVNPAIKGNTRINGNVRIQ